MRHALVHALTQRSKFGREVGFQAQLIADGGVALNDHFKNTIVGDAVLQMCVAQIQKVGDLGVVAAAFPGGGDHHHATLGVGLHDAANLTIVRGVRHRRTAEFQDF